MEATGSDRGPCCSRRWLVGNMGCPLCLLRSTWQNALFASLFFCHIQRELEHPFVSTAGSWTSTCTTSRARSSRWTAAIWRPDRCSSQVIADRTFVLNCYCLSDVIYRITLPHDPACALEQGPKGCPFQCAGAVHPVGGKVVKEKGRRVQDVGPITAWSINFKSQSPEVQPSLLAIEPASRPVANYSTVSLNRSCSNVTHMSICAGAGAGDYGQGCVHARQGGGGVPHYLPAHGRSGGRHGALLHGADGICWRQPAGLTVGGHSQAGTRKGGLPS